VTVRGRYGVGEGRAGLDALTKLTALEEIRALKARYFRCLDGKDWDSLAAVFAPEAVFDLREVNSVRDPITGALEPPPGGEEALYRGREAVMTMIRNAVGRVVTVHHGHMGEIDILSQDEATGIGAMEDLLVSAPGDPPMRMQGAGHYHDRYVRRDGAWRIASTRITRLRLERA